jgi:hypothetical protein
LHSLMRILKGTDCLAAYYETRPYLSCVSGPVFCVF